MQSNRINLNILAIIIGITGWTSFAITDTTMKFVVSHYNQSFILLVEGAIGTLVCAIWLFVKYKKHRYNRARLKWHILRGITVALNAMFILNAVSRIPLADFYSIAFLSPLFLTAGSAIIFKEKLRASRVLAIGLGFAGIIVLAGPQFSSFNIGIIFAFCTSILLATSNLIAKKIGEDDPLPLYALTPFIFILISNIPLFALNYETPEFKPQLIWVFVIPLLVMIGQICVAQAFARAPSASAVAPFCYIQLLWGTIFGYFIFGDIPGNATILGGSIVVTAGVYLITSEKKHFLKQGIELTPPVS